MGYVIDSCIFIHAERSQVHLMDFLQRYSRQPLCMSVVSAAELLHGMHRAKNKEQKIKRTSFVETLLAEIPIVDFDLQIARIYAEIWATLAQKGRSIATSDLMIGATALSMNYSVLTYNTKDFLPIKGLKVVDPTV